MTTNMFQLFKLGDVINGYCNGYFGRNDYEQKTCVLVTAKYVVLEYENGNATVMNHSEVDDFAELAIAEWKVCAKNDS